MIGFAIINLNLFNSKHMQMQFTFVALENNSTGKNVVGVGLNPTSVSNKSNCQSQPRV
jgi:hypothetical protein